MPAPPPTLVAAPRRATPRPPAWTASSPRRRGRGRPPGVGPDLAIVTPGIRPAGAERGDQKRVATPAAAIRAGADYLVVGRPITAAPDPKAAAAAIVAEIEAASSGSRHGHDKGYWIGRLEIKDQAATTATAL